MHSRRTGVNEVAAKSSRNVLPVVFAVVAMLALPIGVAAQQHHHYKLYDLGTFGGPGSTPTEFQQVLNSSSVVVGGADKSQLNPYPSCFNPFNAPDCYVQHAFVWQNGVLKDLGTLKGGSSSFAYFVTDAGLIVGGSETGAIDRLAGTPEYHATVWSNGKIADLGTLGGTSSFATQANDYGYVIGAAQNAISDRFSILGLGTQTRAFLWYGGTMSDLGTLGGPDSFAQIINDQGQIAGVSYTSNSPNPTTGLPTLDPFIWQNGQMTHVPNLGGTNPIGPFIFGLNNSGQIVGGMTTTGDRFLHAFLSDGQNTVDLNAIGGQWGDVSLATALNDPIPQLHPTQVVGIAWLAGDKLAHGFLWQNGVMTDLGTLYGDPCSQAESINSAGQIVGASEAVCPGQFTTAFLWENGGPSADLNTLVAGGSTMRLTGAFWINGQGEITGRGVPSGCNNVDTCGHAFLLIPCDQNHPNIQGCDYSLAGTGTTTAQVSTTPTATVQPDTGLRQVIDPIRTFLGNQSTTFSSPAGSCSGICTNSGVCGIETVGSACSWNGKTGVCVQHQNCTCSCSFQ